MVNLHISILHWEGRADEGDSDDVVTYSCTCMQDCACPLPSAGVYEVISVQCLLETAR